MSRLTIWRFPLQVAAHQVVEMPAAVRLLAVALGTDGTPAIWALVDQDAASRLQVHIDMYGTGWEMCAEVEYQRHLGTVVLGDFVWHYFLASGIGGLDGEIAV